MNKFDNLFNKIINENTFKKKTVKDVIDELEYGLASFADDSEPEDQSAQEELEFYGKDLLSLSDKEKKMVVNYFRKKWSDTPHIAKMIRDYAFDNYTTISYK